MKKLLFLLITINTLCIVLSDTNSNAQNPQWTWAKSTGGITYDYGQNIITDQNGNTYVTGSYGSATITFGSYMLTNDGSLSSFIVKYDANGNVVWADDPQICTVNKGYGVTTDASGNVYMVGVFGSDTIMFGSNMLINKGTYAMYVVKYDSVGNVMWAKTAPGTTFGDDNAYAATTDNAGYLYVTGEFKSDTIRFDTYTLINNGSYDVYVAKYDNNGNVVWATNGVGTSGDFGRGIVADNSGNVYITGHYGSSLLTFGSSSVINNGGYDAYIAKYDTSGTALWVKNVYGSLTENSKGIAIDNSGNPYFIGHSASSTITCGSTVLTNSGGTDMFVIKYDGSGNVLWAKNPSGTSSEYGWSIATDTNGDVYIAGTYNSPTLNFGSSTLTNNGGYDIFVTKYSSGGSNIWAISSGGSLDDKAYGIALDNQNNLFLTGGFKSSSISFSSINLTNSGDYDFFIASMDKNNTTSVQRVQHRPEQIFTYPNPAQDFINIDYEGKDEPTIEITNMSGQILYNKKLDKARAINISNYPEGVYFIKVIGRDIFNIEKVVKY